MTGTAALRERAEKARDAASTCFDKLQSTITAAGADAVRSPGAVAITAGLCVVAHAVAFVGLAVIYAGDAVRAAARERVRDS